jgi:DNA-directed RNA polymerase subunit N (RpoN/RPB10)
MIIPIRCFTCGKVLADKWQAYEKKVKEQEKSAKTEDEVHPNFQRNFKGEILDQLGLDRICCRRHMLSHVDLIDII